ncbi:hypothetical protein PABG_11370 [Paracoccidioides brasiliensis Pb03]|nr:hypothetical protein PABG_11370 [Paracoccidioides brasiliensis Pb03]
MPSTTLWNKGPKTSSIALHPAKPQRSIGLGSLGFNSQTIEQHLVLGTSLGSAERIYKEDEDAKLTARKRNNGWDAMRDRREAISLFADHYRHI